MPRPPHLINFEKFSSLVSTFSSSNRPNCIVSPYLSSLLRLEGSRIGREVSRRIRELMNPGSKILQPRRESERERERARIPFSFFNAELSSLFLSLSLFLCKIPEANVPRRKRGRDALMGFIDVQSNNWDRQN